MLFSEIYGSYYTAVAQILSRAVEGSLTGKELTVIVQETAFGESLLTIPSALKEERWPFLDLNLNTPVQHEPAMPLSVLQKQWLKALLPETEKVRRLYNGNPEAFRFDIDFRSAVFCHW